MNSCILTVIKNEHQYLDEWIKYHLDLGVNHIFIFEDIDSDSHKEICDKYGDKVSLDSILVVLDEEERNRIAHLKLIKSQNHNDNPQYSYIKKGLTYLKKLNKYDWCFVIDNDEFITLEKDNLKNVLSLFEGYDAFIMQWKCYGANGLINKPDYKNKGVVETFTKEIQGYVPTSTPQSLSKTCYNLNTYQENYFLYTHQPSKECNFCRTNFERNRNKPVYDNIYIRHYITKSWEEYVWKLKTRGYFFGKLRTFDAFFQMNSDMNDLKASLLSELKQETLVILPYKQNGSQGDEIKITLNGWRKFCQFKYHFVVIGTFDKSLRYEFPWVEFIDCPQLDKKENQYNPHLDIQNKFKIICNKYSKIYDGFIWICDDYYPVKQFVLKDITDIHYHASNFIGNEKCPTSYWRHDKWKTRELLDRENLPHFNYTIHYPCYFEFNKIKEIWKRFNMFEESYVVEDIYFNYFEHEEPILDSTIRLGIWGNDIYKNEFQKAVENPNIKFMCNSVEGWSKELENDLWKIVDLGTNNDMVLDYINNNKIRKLHIGCGSNILDGWLNTDISVKNRNVMFMDAGSIFPIPSQSFDYIFSEHLFEHLTYEQAKNMLNECYRILKPNGIIRIATPNLKFLIDLYLNPQKEINKSYIEFDSKRSGLPPHPIFAINRFHTTWGHKIIYDPDSLIMMLESSSFKNIHQCEVGKSEYIDLCMVEGHHKSFERQKADKDYNALQTMVFEAQR